MLQEHADSVEAFAELYGTLLADPGEDVRQRAKRAFRQSDTMCAVPSRRRPKTPVPEIVDPVTQFGRMLRESSEREQAAQDAAARRRQEAKNAARAATEHAEALKSARRQLERAIAGVKDARRSRRGVAEADASWSTAKARLIELETGQRPAWHRSDSSAATVDDAGASTADDR
jgi:hypothetical protein